MCNILYVKVVSFYWNKNYLLKSYIFNIECTNKIVI